MNRISKLHYLVEYEPLKPVNELTYDDNMVVIYENYKLLTQFSKLIVIRTTKRQYVNIIKPMIYYGQELGLLNHIYSGSVTYCHLYERGERIEENWNSTNFIDQFNASRMQH